MPSSLRNDLTVTERLTLQQMMWSAIEAEQSAASGEESCGNRKEARAHERRAKAYDKLRLKVNRLLEGGH